MNQTRLFKMALMVMFITIMVMLSVFWQIGYPLLFGAVNANLLIIPVLIGVFVFPLKYGLILGFLMGLSSYILSVSLGFPIFDNPLISVIPRTLFILPAFYGHRLIRTLNERYPKNGKNISFAVISAVSVFALYYGIEAIVSIYDGNFNAFVPFVLLASVLVITFYYAYINKIKQDFIYIPTSLILGTLLHSVLTISAMIIFGDSMWSDILVLLSTNVFVEAFLVVLIATPIVVTIKTLYPNIDKE